MHLKLVLDCIPEGARCVVTIDCDGLDPSVIPGVLVPQPGGLSFTDIMALFDGLITKASIEGVDVVELVPSKDLSEIGPFPRHVLQGHRLRYSPTRTRRSYLTCNSNATSTIFSDLPLQLRQKVSGLRRPAPDESLLLREPFCSPAIFDLEGRQP